MHTYSNDLLLPYPHTGWTTSQPFIPKMMPFEPSDSEYLYQANQQRQPDTWYYRTHEVTYTWNSNGYRAGEWAGQDWASSWLVMGCSHVVGIGVAYEDTLSEQLSRYIGAPCINLGMGGAGMDVIVYNTLRLIDAGIRPQGVVIVAPNLSRLTMWRSQDYVNLNPHYEAEDPYIKYGYDAWLRSEPNAELHSYMKLRSAIALWQAEGVRVIPTHYQKEQNADHTIGLHLPPRQDYARDVDVRNGQMTGHFGRATLGSWARAIAEVIQRP